MDHHSVDHRRQAIAGEIPRLRRYARALSGADVDADDLVQETLTRALSHLDQWINGDNPRKWLFSILHNHYVDGLRRSTRRPAHISIDAGDYTPATLGSDAGIRYDLDRGLQALAEEQRQVLLLVGLEGLSYAETADILGIPIGTVMSRLARGREKLRREMMCDIGEHDVAQALPLKTAAVKIGSAQ
jgi:RNA polymerase sigma-70 factor, ECF subfamily